MPRPAEDRRVEDSLPHSWVDHAPMALRPYLRLARYDRPAGFWLLALPGFAGVALAGLSDAPRLEHWRLIALIALGAVAMRGAGCAYNDIVDKDLDAKVARTANRPLAAGTVSLPGAWAFVIAQCLVGLAVLIALPRFAQIVSLAAIPLVAAYPFMKRITWWPQAWLGLTFNWGVLVGFAAAYHGLRPEALWLYVGLAVWTLGYDTIYACQDKEDDALIGVKSTARLFGNATRIWVCGFYALSVGLSGIAVVLSGAPLWALAAVIPFAGHLALQAWRFDPADGLKSLALFTSNRGAGLVLAAGLAAAAALAI